MIELVIFDLDGVLVDACEWHRLSLNYALKEVSNYEITLDDHKNIFNGIPTKVKLKKLLDLNIIKSEDLNKIEDLKQKNTINIINSDGKIRYEKINLLNFLKSKNIKVACYTNSIRDTAELMLNKTGILNLFDLIVTNQDVSFPKPNPEGYIKILNYFNVDKNSTIIVEDSPNGFEAAYLSGCKVFKVNNQEQVNIELFEGFI
jgi:beta-phosphoglucomutase